MRSIIRRGAVLACGGAMALAAAPATAGAQAPSTGLERYVDQVSVPRIVKHLQALQRIADRNGGTRVSGSQGHLDSVRYVVGQLRSAGYKPTVQAFPFAFFQKLTPSTFERVSPSPRVYEEGGQTGFHTMDYSGSGDVTAAVQGVDLVLPPGPTPSSSTSGCEASDFAGFKPGNIALLQRGTCTFGQKVANAEAAGAVGAI